MPSKKFDLPGVGSVTVTKRRGAKNIRLTINPRGQVRVSIPYWIPYAAGLSFAKSRQDWLSKKLAQNPKTTLADGDRVGKSYRLKFVTSASKRTSTSLTTGTAIVRVSPYSKPEEIEEAAIRISQKALKKEAEHLLPMRTRELAKKFGFNYKDIQIKNLTSKWGSCSSDKVISLSYFLMQLPWELIDYVILHELTHTKHLNHSASFWEDLLKVCPKARQHQKWIRSHKPVVTASN